jgi:hypothetical protein
MRTHVRHLHAIDRQRPALAGNCQHTFNICSTAVKHLLDECEANAEQMLSEGFPKGFSKGYRNGNRY